jgi:hypothetical protein
MIDHHETCLQGMQQLAMLVRRCHIQLCEKFPDTNDNAIGQFAEDFTQRRLLIGCLCQRHDYSSAFMPNCNLGDNLCGRLGRGCTNCGIDRTELPFDGGARHRKQVEACRENLPQSGLARDPGLSEARKTALA